METVECVNKLPEDVKKCLDPKKVFMFSKSYCPYCVTAKDHLDKLGVQYQAIECDEVPMTMDHKKQLYTMSGITSFPNIFIGDKSIGGCDNLIKLHAKGDLKKLLDQAGIKHN